MITTDTQIILSQHYHAIDHELSTTQAFSTRLQSTCHLLKCHTAVALLASVISIFWYNGLPFIFPCLKWAYINYTTSYIMKFCACLQCILSIFAPLPSFVPTPLTDLFLLLTMSFLLFMSFFFFLERDS